MKGMKVLLSIGAIPKLLSNNRFLLPREDQEVMWRGSGGWEPGSPYNRMYDPKTIKTVTGKIMSISQSGPHKGMGAGGLHDFEHRKRNHLGPPRSKLGGGEPGN